MLLMLEYNEQVYTDIYKSKFKVRENCKRNAQRERSVLKMGGATKFGMVNKTKT